MKKFFFSLLASSLFVLTGCQSALNAMTDVARQARGMPTIEEEKQQKLEAEKNAEAERIAKEKEAYRQERIKAAEYRAKRLEEAEKLYQEAMKSFGSEKSANMLRRAAADGSVNAQYNLGVAYMLGAGVVQDRYQGIKFLQLAANQKHAEAQNALGQNYLKMFEATLDNQWLTSAYICLEAAYRNGIKHAKKPADKAKRLLLRDTGNQMLNNQLRSFLQQSEPKIQSMVK